ncbi:hypothetical protein [Namhaeicola litoreus]|uniref:Uncharacterized protein n=1 Tax=Namhaeicola litoreus TaxID=1052145 RepID=A0ABW3Y2U4_9FLAO
MSYSIGNQNHHNLHHQKNENDVGLVLAMDICKYPKINTNNVRDIIEFLR